MLEIIDYAKILEQLSSLTRFLIALSLFLLVLTGLTLWNLYEVTKMLGKRESQSKNIEIQSAVNGEGNMSGKLIFALSGESDFTNGQILTVKRKLGQTETLHDIGLVEVLTIENGVANCVVYKGFNRSINDMEVLLSNHSLWNEFVFSQRIIRGNFGGENDGNRN